MGQVQKYRLKTSGEVVTAFGRQDGYTLCIFQVNGKNRKAIVQPVRNEKLQKVEVLAG